MGNNLTHHSSIKTFDNINKDLPDIYYSLSLGDGWFLKTAKCIYKDSPIIVKVYPKENFGTDKVYLEDTIKKYQEILENNLHTCSSFKNVCAYQKFIETSKKIYLIRQYFFNNLRDRIETRPLLTQTEKIWITYLLLRAVDECHSKNIFHGDIKLENIMLTSWNWIYLTDFACYKPTFISDDKPYSFSYYFDTSGSRNCYLAPERFIKSEYIEIANEKQPFTPEMDIFSVGCVIAELFLDRAHFLSLSDLLKYKQGKLDITEKINKIPQKAVRNLVKQMTHINPGQRGSIKSYLNSWNDKGFPSYFNDLHLYILNLMDKDADDKVLSIRKDFLKLKSQFKLKGSKIKKDNKNNNTNSSLSSPSADLSETTFRDTESFILTVNHNLNQIPNTDLVSSFLGTSTYFEEDETINTPPSPVFNHSKALVQYPGMVCLLSILCSHIHEVKSTSIQIDAIELFIQFSETLDDKCRLQRIVPYLISLLKISNVRVQSSAIVALVKVLEMVNTFPPSDIKIFPEYILPSLKPLTKSNEPLLLCTLAKYLGNLAMLSNQFSKASEIMLTESVVFNYSHQKNTTMSEDIKKEKLTFIKFMKQLSKITPERNNALINDIRCLLLENIKYIITVVEQESTIDNIIPLLTKFLETSTSWELCKRIFICIPSICDYIGEPFARDCIFPFVLKYIYHPDILIINSALRTFYQISDYFTKIHISHIIEGICPLLLYPNKQLKHNIIHLLIKLSNHSKIHTSDIYSFILPEISKYLTRNIQVCKGDIILSNLKQPISQILYDDILRYCRSLYSIPVHSKTSLRYSTQQQEEICSLINGYIEQKNIINQDDCINIALLTSYISTSITFFPTNRLLELFYSEQTPEQFEFLTFEKSDQTNICFILDREKQYSKSDNLSSSSLLYSTIPSITSFGSIKREFKPIPTNWMPKGILVHSFVEHELCVNRIDTTPDNKLLISVSDDHTIRIWDSEHFGKLDCNSLLTSSFDSPVTSLVTMTHTNGFLIGEENGNVRCFRIDGADSSNYQLSAVVTYELTYPIVEILTISDFCFLVLTKHGDLYGIDVREQNIIFHKSIPKHFGSIRCAVNNKDQDWAVIGTSRGYYSCWDLRLVIEISNWKHPFKHNSSNNYETGSIERLCLYQTENDTDAYIFASTSNSEIYRWNIATQLYDNVLIISDGELWKVPNVEQLLSPLDYASQCTYKNKHSENQMHRALFSLPKSGHLITGSADCCIRNWNINTPRDSSIICGWENSNYIPSYDQTSIPTLDNKQILLIQEHTKESETKTQTKYKHHDCIMDIKAIRPPNSEVFLISCSRDGVINIWR